MTLSAYSNTPSKRSWSVKKLMNWVVGAVVAVSLELGAAHAEQCSNEVDVWFMNDSSGSVSSAEFTSAKNFINAIASNFQLSSSGAHAGVLDWNTTLRLIIPATGDATSFASSMGSYPKYSGSDVIGAMLQSANTNYIFKNDYVGGLNSSGSRENIKKLVVVMTDMGGFVLGAADRNKLIAESQYIRDSGSEIIFILIEEAAEAYQNDTDSYLGPNTGFTQTFDAAAGTAGNLFLAATYEEALTSSALISEVSSRACSLSLNTSGSGSNAPPTASSGSDQAVSPGSTVNISGTASDADGDTLSWTWEVVSTSDETNYPHSNITLIEGEPYDVFFTAPSIPEGSELDVTVRFTVIDGRGGVTSDDVVIRVSAPHTSNSGSNDADASLQVGDPVSNEIPTTADTVGEAVDLLSFNLRDGGGSDGTPLSVTTIDVNVSGTGAASASKLTWLLNGPDATNVQGTIGGGKVTFSGLGISVDDGANETYTVSAYFNDNTGLTDGQTLILSSDGDTDVTVATGSTTFGTTTPVTNGSGAAIDVLAVETNWANWTRETSFPFSTTSFNYRYRNGGSGTVTDPNSGQSVSFSLTGEVLNLSAYSDDNSINWYNTENPESAYTGTLIRSPQGSDRVGQSGYTTAQYRAHEIVFDTEVTGLVMGIWSLGSRTDASAVEFERAFEIVVTDDLSASVSNTGYRLSGRGSAGIIQFCGPIRSLKWNTTNPELYAAFNFAITNLPATCADGPAKAVPGFDTAGPVITGPSAVAGDANGAVSIAEGTTAVTRLTATDDNTFTWSIAPLSEGYDNGLFSIDANGNLRFIGAPDYETPLDEGATAGNNTYLVRVVASDSFGNASTQDVKVTVTDVDEIAPSIEQTDGVNEPVGGPTAAVSVPEGQRLVTTYSANETVQWSISGGADADAFEITSGGVLRFMAENGADFEAPTDLGDGAGNNTYVVVVTARDAAGNTSFQTLTVTVTDLWDSLPGTVPVYSSDLDADGIADSLESATADRDGDGVADARDYDPQGYLYCENDGRILAGGRISVSGPNGSNNAVGVLNNIRIVKDGSDGEYQWFATAPGTYTMSVTYPTSVGVPSTTRASSGTLDVTNLLPNNPASIGSSEFGTTGFLSNYWDGGSDPNVAANATTAFYTTFEIEAGDPNVIGNNIPVAQCGVNKVSIATASDGAEANGDTTSPLIYTVSQTRVSTQDTVIAYRVAGASQAMAGVDFAAVSGFATITAGQTSTQITVAVLEDGLIEGDEAVVLELTDAAGDLTTTLTDVAGGRSASAVIVDDDFTDVVINEIDLTTTEGRDTDPAIVGLFLAGQPTAPVVMSITVGSQCTVSPNTLTFTAETYAAEQRLTIRAVNDELVEGAHSCQPIVSISSADLRYHGFNVTMPQITIADDLVDQLRTPLKNILQSDFTNTVSAQSRAMSGISRGALDRLHDGANEEECQTFTPMAFDGTTKANEDGANSAWSFDQDNLNCVTGVRTITDGSFTFSKSDGSDEQGLFSMTMQKETQQGTSSLSGVFAGGYVSRTSLTGIGTGAVDGVGVMGGIYGARSMQNGLVVDYYAGGSTGVHRYDFSFYTPSAAIRADGKYSYSGAFAGAALSGEVTHEKMRIRPRLGFGIGRASANDASVSARQLDQTDTGRIRLDAVEGVRGYAEAVFSFGTQVNEESSEDAPRPIRKFEFAPSVFCEQAFGMSDTSCGGGASIRFTNSNPMTGSDLEVTLDLEGTGDVQRSRIGLSYTEQILGGAGSVVSTLGTDATGNAQIGQSVEIKF